MWVLPQILLDNSEILISLLSHNDFLSVSCAELSRIFFGKFQGVVLTCLIQQGKWCISGKEGTFKFDLANLI